VIPSADQMSYIDNSNLSMDFTHGAEKVDIALVRVDDIIKVGKWVGR